MKYLIVLLLFLSSCGDPDSPQTFEIQGETKECTVLSYDACGLTVACEDGGGIHQCVSN